MDLLRKLLVFAVILLHLQRSESAVGVCSKTVSHSVSRSESSLVYRRQSYRYYTSCGFLWLSRCSRTGYRNVGSAVHTTKYSRQYKLEKECCSGYAGNAPSCRRECNSLGHPSNGRVSVRSRTEGSTATYSCDNGYALSGSSSRSCQSDGTWSGGEPICHVVCRSPPGPSNGYMSVRSTYVGGAAYYYCNSGYQLSGSSPRVCQSSGSWSGIQPSCIRVCPALTSPSNGFVSVNTYNVYGIATYTCNNGYGLSGTSSRTCSSSGSWSRSDPTCQRICPTLSNPSNGQVSVSSYFGRGRAVYSCNGGYGLLGSATDTCSTDGSWSGSPPSCHRLCPALSSPRNGAVSVNTYFPGSTASYTCNSGYDLSDESSLRTCSSHGIWSGSDITCERVCPTRNPPINGDVSVSTHNVEGVATFTCDNGYELSGSSRCTCLATGSWSEEVPVCIGLCLYPDQLRNGIVSVASLLVGENATYACHDGYRLSGDSTRRCQTSRTWSGRLPECIRVCPPLKHPSDGKVSVNIPDVGATATYTCNTGYGVIGSPTRNCLFDGTWSGKQPSCNTTCPRLSTPHHGQLKVQSYFDGGIAVYTCDNGYYILGSFDRICKQGNWSGIDPACQELMCPLLTAPTEGNVSVSSYQPGGIATYICKSRDNIANEHRYCTANGRWSGSPPNCLGNVGTDCPMKAFDKDLEEIARSIVSSLNDKKFSENTCIFIAAFETLVDILGVKPSEKNYNGFIVAMNEIGQVHELCKEDKTAEDIQKLADEIVSTFSVNSKNEDISNIRELVGKLLCNAEKTRPKRQSDEDENCECPLGGIQNIGSACEFYKCLNSSNMKSIFGFDLHVDREDKLFPCLAFIVDTTGSMSEEIDAVKKIILEFVHAEKEFATSEGCYMLVPFNDVGPDKANVPNESIGPITVAYADDIEQLLSFYNNVTALKAIPNSGGDIHEYALDAMLDALEFTMKGDDDPLLLTGSQMIVLTDAPSKNKDLKLNVTSLAMEEYICIHFFVSYHSFLEDGIYQYVADKTEGTFVNPYTNWTLATFVSSYKERKCGVFIQEREERASSISSKCSSFKVSLLASMFKFSGKANNMVTLISPSGKSIEVASKGGVAVHARPNPEFGEWQACADTGITNLEVSVYEDIVIDATIFYFNNLEGSNRTSVPPTECSSGTVTLLTSKASLCGTINLNLINPRREILYTIPMNGCGQMFSGNATFPSGSYTYQISGTDSLGTPFQTSIKKVTFREGKYKFEIDDPNDLLELKGQEIAEVSVTIHNNNRFPSTFKLSAKILDLSVHSEQVEITVPAFKSSVVTVPIVVPDSLSHGIKTLTILSENGCSTLTVDKTVTIIKEAPPVTSAPNECGCLNSGICRFITRRGRVYKRCSCPSGYRGSKCQFTY